MKNSWNKITEYYSDITLSFSGFRLTVVSQEMLSQEKSEMGLECYDNVPVEDKVLIEYLWTFLYEYKNTYRF